ncbi:DUF6020 family protein [Bifidobacterium gallicum]|nr:DUF6020 family protein [Bifidobacterium gallicum]
MATRTVSTPAGRVQSSSSSPNASNFPQRQSSNNGRARASHGSRAASIFTWAIAALACLWIAWCTAIGPCMRSDQGLASFGAINVLWLVLTFAITFGIVWLLWAYGSGRLPRWWRARRHSPRMITRIPSRTADHPSPHATADPSPLTTDPSPLTVANPSPLTADTRAAASRASRASAASRTASSHPAHTTHHLLPTPLHLFLHRSGRKLTHATNRFWKLFLVFFIGWLWVPATLLSAFGADIRSQAREFSWAWNQWTGLDQPYIGFFSFVPMDIYPTAHYLWPHDPTYLTDQHNVVLTVFYGAVTAFSRYLTGSNDLGFVTLSVLQFAFAAFAVASAAHRFLNLPWLSTSFTPTPSRGCDLEPRSHAHPERGFLKRTRPAGGAARLWILLFFLGCPLVWFSTISITKSPLFAFAFVWWFGVLYEFACTRGHVRPRTLAAMVGSVIIMLISAKYAWYILMLQVVLCMLADRRRWKVYLLTMFLPTLLIHGGISALGHQGLIITGDPIESRGIQLQMIARVAKHDPKSIPQSAREKLAPIFNLDQMADAYFRQDADPVKSSGIQSKKTSYRWRTVTPEDMKQFNSAWLEIVQANPQVAMDAFFAECYGYFDVVDEPYVAMSYYVNNDYVQSQTEWIGQYNHDWRNDVVHFVNSWSHIPVLGWLTHGNFYVTLTLLFGAAELVLRRWRTLAWHIPLLMLMGVMVMAPANNFERHMLPLAFVFGFLVLTFVRDTRRANTPRTSYERAAKAQRNQGQQRIHSPQRDQS